MDGGEPSVARPEIRRLAAAAVGVSAKNHNYRQGMRAGAALKDLPALKPLTGPLGAQSLDSPGRRKAAGWYLRYGPLGHYLDLSSADLDKRLSGARTDLDKMHEPAYCDP